VAVLPIMAVDYDIAAGIVGICCHHTSLHPKKFFFNCTLFFALEWI
jgi:hypothetical protein